MESSPALLSPPPVTRPRALPRLKLLIEMEPAHRVFFDNLNDLLFHRSVPAVVISSRPAAFWNDVFIYDRAPWSSFVESMLWHTVIVGLLGCIFYFWAPRETHQQRNTLKQSYISYTPPPKSYSTHESRRTPARNKTQREAEHREAIRVASEHKPKLITPPDIKMAAARPPDIAASNPLLPSAPLTASTRARLALSAGSTSVVAPAPNVNQAAARRSGLGQAAAVAPSPEIGAASARRAMSAPNASVVTPAPSVESSIRKRGDINIGHSEAVQPSPQLPIQEQRTSGLGHAALGNPSSASVVAPPPSVDSASGAGGSGRGRSLAGNGLQVVVRPAPSVEGIGNTAGSGRGKALSNGGSQVVPPPASLEGAGNSLGHGRGKALSSANSQAVPPPASVDGTGNSMGRGRGGSLSGSGSSEVVPPPPSVEGEGDSNGRGNGNSLSTDGEAVPPPPSVDGTDGSGGGGQQTAMNASPSVAEPPQQATDNEAQPKAEDLPVRLIGLVLALPGSSYFSNYEVFIAQRKLDKDKLELIKLVYEFLPYQRRLSDYGLNNAKVHKLRVVRDQSCDETLIQMMKPQPGETNSALDPRVKFPELGTFDGNTVLHCYRTTADEYRKAFSK